MIDRTRLRTLVGCRPPTPCAAAGAASRASTAHRNAKAHNVRPSRIVTSSRPGAAGTDHRSWSSAPEDAVVDEIERDERHRDRRERTEDPGRPAAWRACPQAATTPVVTRIASAAPPMVGPRPNSAAQAIAAATGAGPARSGTP